MDCPKCGNKMIKESEYEWYNIDIEKRIDKIYHCEDCDTDYRVVLAATTKEIIKIEPFYFG